MPALPSLFWFGCVHFFSTYLSNTPPLYMVGFISYKAPLLPLQTTPLFSNFCYHMAILASTSPILHSTMTHRLAMLIHSWHLLHYLHNSFNSVIYLFRNLPGVYCNAAYIFHWLPHKQLSWPALPLPRYILNLLHTYHNAYHTCHIADILRLPAMPSSPSL